MKVICLGGPGEVLAVLEPGTRLLPSCCFAVLLGGIVGSTSVPMLEVFIVGVYTMVLSFRGL
jgi:hypothetical protein